MIVSLLSLQGRASKNAEVASQLAAAADRITTMCRIHQHLHTSNGAPTVAIKQYLEELCRDFSTMWSLGSPDRGIVVEGIEINLPAATAIPLGFIANELITNAAKYGTGRITLNLESNPQQGYLLSVSDEGPGLPEGFDPTGSKGLGMRIIRSFVEQIGGELRIGRSDSNQGTRFTVLFLRAACDPIPAVIKASAISNIGPELTSRDVCYESTIGTESGSGADIVRRPTLTHPGADIVIASFPWR